MSHKLEVNFGVLYKELKGKEKQDYLYEYLKDNPSKFPARLWDELVNKYKAEFALGYGEPKSTDGKNVYGGLYWDENGRAIVQVRTGFCQLARNLDRVLSHEFLHIRLRYRENLPFLESKTTTGKQSLIINAMDHELINPVLDRECGKRKKLLREKKTQKILVKIEPCLNKVYEGIDKDKYIEIFKDCANILGEEIPRFLFVSRLK